MPEGFHWTFPNIQYMTSFPLTTEQASRTEIIREQLRKLKENTNKKFVLLVISLAGIKICSPDGKIVHMAHALRRISYATFDPENSIFSFLAREPRNHFNIQYCHSFLGRSPQQAEELNTIVGNAFRMAYAAQLQKQPTFQDVITSQLDQTQTNKVLWSKDLSVTLKKDKLSLQQNNLQTTEMDVELTNTDTSTLRLAPPSSIPGLKASNKFNVLGPTEKSQSQQSTPSSDESNSPTEMNSYKRMTEKPPLIKRIAMGLTGGHHINNNNNNNNNNNSNHNSNNNNNHNNNINNHNNNHNNNDDDNCPLVSDSPNSTPGSPTNRPLSGGYVNETTNDTDSKTLNKTLLVTDNIKNNLVENINTNLTKHIDIDNSKLFQNSSPSTNEHEFKSKRISQISSSSSSSCPQTGTDSTIVLGFTPTPPPLPERTDSLNNREEGELRTAPWFQAGIPREIALEILAQEPVGAFMVRESTSKPGCFALSLRVPRTFQPTGIAHYLIVRSNKGYKIKGFTKEFSTLTSLITHHSVMPELLPCPLSLSRYNPSFVKSDSKKDFADIDLDPDYNTLADFRKMMADINI